MFTGIVEATGKVESAGGRTVTISSSLEGLEVGDSIAVDGVCVTITTLRDGDFTADFSEETLERTTLGGLTFGQRVNLERPLPAMGRLGGHIVQGHVDGRGTVVSMEGTILTVELPEGLERYAIEKGSIAVDGVSLTIATIGHRTRTFSVALVPYTIEETNLGERSAGDEVNIEVDLVAKYVEKLMEAR